MHFCKWYSKHQPQHKFDWFVSLNISNLRNPPNTQPVTGFVLRSFNTIGELETTSGLSVGVFTTYGGSLTNCSIVPSTSQVNKKSSYTFSFYTSNPITSSSSIKILFPSSISLQYSSIILTFGFDYSSVTTETTQSSITLTNIIESYEPEPYYFEFTID
jgi:hypothetical protein